MPTPQEGGAIYWPPFWTLLPDPTSGLAVMQYQASLLLAPLLKRTRVSDRVGNGSVTDVLAALARALVLAQEGHHHWLTVNYVELAEHLPPEALAAPLRCGSVTEAFADLLELLLALGDEAGEPRRGPLQRSLIDLLLHERIDHVIRSPEQAGTVVMRVGTEVAALSRTPSGRRAADKMLMAAMKLGDGDMPDAVSVRRADIGAGETTEWLGLRVSQGVETKVDISESAWDALGKAWAQVGDLSDNPDETILPTWLRWTAPAFEHIDIDFCCARISAIAEQQGVIAPPHGCLEANWQAAFTEWVRLRERERGQ